jgi:formamidopyrimidine-DNA glycosylase
MPELPDVELYVERLRALAGGQELAQVRLGSPFVLRSVRPPLAAAHGRTLTGVRRLGKRVVLQLAPRGEESGAPSGDLFLVVHLMIAGRLRWRPHADPASPAAALPAKRGLVAFDFANGTLLLTEEGSKKRAALHVVEGEAALAEHDPGGLEVFGATVAAFGAALSAGRHTLKRALTDPRVLAGIGNAYSDEILLRARLSPFQRTDALSEDELGRLFAATQAVLRAGLERLRREVGDGFPEKVTAFRPDFGAHGRYGQPCPQCGTAIQRIQYADNESNYCPTCQSGGKLLADRGLSRLLGDDWPRTLVELELHRQERRTGR